MDLFRNSPKIDLPWVLAAEQTEPMAATTTANIFDAKTYGIASFFNPPPKTPDEEYRYYLCIKDRARLKPTYYCKRGTYESVLTEKAQHFVDSEMMPIVAIRNTLPAFLDQPRMAYRLNASVTFFREGM
jgi:hypothetical protein